MFPYDPNHQTFLNVYEGEALTQAILDRGRPTFEYYAGTRQGVWAVIRRFIPAGVSHIVIGPDHLVFLFGLLLLGGTVRQFALVVSSFTLAHTLALSLAAFNILSSPARIVEPAIALSIVYIGADNLLARGGRDMRVWIAGAFGFIHGLAFANVLRDLDLPARALKWSLASFNVGLLIGQLVVVAAVGWLLASVRSRNESAARQVVFAGSLAVMAAGAFWFVQRVFFPA
jgi:hydrogenase/urease accessory protein HupE